MILVGQYDSPFVRRVAISLRVLGFEYQHDTRSVFADFDDMRQTNPLARRLSRDLFATDTRFLIGVGSALRAGGLLVRRSGALGIDRQGNPPLKFRLRRCRVRGLLVRQGV